ncbi:hypothetical protein C8R42DRAFT_709171 [Lentinula raphanica]|nr:hypothetical protein C8R42DRAFT_709171 [Lentinula raphanica]
MEVWLLTPHTKKHRLTTTTIYLWDANLRRNNIGHRNGMWLVFSKWDSELDAKETNHSVTDTGDVWEEFNFGEPDINDEGVWVRIGQWIDKEHSAATFEFDPDPRPDESYDIRAHLRKTLTEWTVSNKMRSTGEERDVRRHFLEPRLLLRLCWVWNSTYPTTLLGGMWLVDWSWKEDAGVLSGGVEAIYRILPHRNRAPGQDPFETYPPNEHRGVRINTGGEWARMGHLHNMTDADPRWAQWTQLMTNFTELDLDSPRYL